MKAFIIASMLMGMTATASAYDAQKDWKGSCMAMMKTRIKSKKITQEKADQACECQAKTGVEACGDKCKTAEGTVMFMSSMDKGLQTKIMSCLK